MAKIKASQTAAILFLFHFIFFGGRKILSIFRKKKLFCKNEKKSLQSHLFEPPGRSTGNRIIFKDSLNQLTDGVCPLILLTTNREYRRFSISSVYSTASNCIRSFIRKPIRTEFRGIVKIMKICFDRNLIGPHSV